MHLVVQIVQFFTQFLNLPLEMYLKIITCLSGQRDSSCQSICKGSRSGPFNETKRFNGALMAVGETKSSQFMIGRHAIREECCAKLFAREWRTQLFRQLNRLLKVRFGKL